MFEGVGVALITPFNSDGTVDLQSLKNLVQHVVAGNVDFLVVWGTTSEAPVLSGDEKELVFETVRQYAKDKPIVLGIGGNNTEKVIKEIHKYELKFRFDGILSVCPYYNKPQQNGLIAHFSALAEATDKPIVLYNVPGRTSSDLLSESIIYLAESYKNIVAVKEASGKIERGMDIMEKLSRKDFKILSGDDALYFPELAVGYDGVISVIANAFPKEFVEMTNLVKQGKISEARAIHYKLYPFVKLIFKEGNPTGIKALLELQNIISTDVVRLPLVPASEYLRRKLKKALRLQILRRT